MVWQKGRYHYMYFTLIVFGWKDLIGVTLSGTRRCFQIQQVWLSALRKKGLKYVATVYVSTAPESSGGMLYTTPSDACHCAWWCKACMQLFSHGKPFHEAPSAQFCADVKARKGLNLVIDQQSVGDFYALCSSALSDPLCTCSDASWLSHCGS